MPVVSTRGRVRPKPFLFPEFCKACGRCIEACPKECIELAQSIDPRTGLTPVVVHIDACNGCGLCLDACPEPYGLLPMEEGVESDLSLADPATVFGTRQSTAPEPVEIPDRLVPLPQLPVQVLKGTHASAVGALLAGCRQFFGYPITPSTEGAELMAKVLPQLDGVFLQAISEVAAINMMYGCGGAGQRSMTFTSSPGFSLMLEGISYMIGAEVPAVVVDIMRGGPGLGNIAPEQADIKLACRGLGHGNTHAIVLAPSTPQEMLDLTMLAFDKAFEYRNPVVVVGDGYLGQMTGQVRLPEHLIEPGIPEWAVYGDREHRRNLISSIVLDEEDLERHNEMLLGKYERIAEREQRAESSQCEDADWVLIACNTPARMAKGAVRELREMGIRAGLFRPITLWPFPIRELAPIAERARSLVVVEAGPGQLEDEMRLALSHAHLDRFPRIDHVRRYGGVLPSQREIVDAVAHLEMSHG